MGRSWLNATKFHETDSQNREFIHIQSQSAKPSFVALGLR